MTDSPQITGQELLAFIERYESLQAERKATGELQKELMAEAKGQGYDTKILRQIVRIRARPTAEISEEEAILELYKSAIGMS